MSEYSTDAAYMPPTRGSISIYGMNIGYHVDDPAGLHDPRTKAQATVEVMQRVKKHDIAYSFRNGRCVAMRNSRKYDVPDDATLKRGYRNGMWKARDKLKAVIESARKDDIPGNVQSILRAGLGIDEKVAA
jgi:hypothetical protein